MVPLPFAIACVSKLGGNLSRGRTTVLTVHGSSSGGFGSSMSTESRWVRDEPRYGQAALTVVPGSGSNTNDLSFVLLVVYDGANTEAHHRQWRHILRCVLVRLGKGVDIFWIRYRRLKFTPGKLVDIKEKSGFK